MKIILSFLFLVSVGTLLYWNRSLRKAQYQMAATDQALLATPTPTLPAPSNSPSTITSPSISPPLFDRQSLINALLDDQEQLKSQINAASEASINQQIKTTQDEITQLQNQMTEYQSAESALHQNAQTRILLSESLARQTAAHITARISAIERQERVAQRELDQVNRYPDSYQNDRATQIQSSLQEMQNEIIALTKNQEDLQAQSERDTASLGNEVFNAQANLQAMVQSTQSQIDFLQRDLSQLNNQKSTAQNTVTGLRLSLQDVEQRIAEARSGSGAIPSSAPTSPPLIISTPNPLPSTALPSPLPIPTLSSVITFPTLPPVAALPTIIPSAVVTPTISFPTPFPQTVFFPPMYPPYLISPSGYPTPVYQAKP